MGPGGPCAYRTALARGSGTPAASYCAPPSSGALPCSVAWSIFPGRVPEVLSILALLFLDTITCSSDHSRASLSLPPDSPDSSFPTLTTSWLPLCQWLSAQEGAEGCACSSRCGFPSPTFLLRSEAWPSALKYHKSEVFMSLSSLFFKVTDCACSFSKSLNVNFKKM